MAFFIQVPLNKVKHNIKEGITYLAWIKPSKTFAPIFKFSVYFGIDRSGRLEAVFMPLSSRGRKLVSPRPVKMNRWLFVGVSFVRRTRVASLYINNKLVKTKRFSKPVKLASFRPGVLGVYGRKTYRGKISCLQLYNVGLSSRQVARRRKRCFKGMFDINIFYLMDYGRL